MFEFQTQLYLSTHSCHGCIYPIVSIIAIIAIIAVPILLYQFHYKYNTNSSLLVCERESHKHKISFVTLPFHCLPQVLPQCPLVLTKTSYSSLHADEKEKKQIECKLKIYTLKKNSMRIDKRLKWLEFQEKLKMVRVGTCVKIKGDWESSFLDRIKEKQHDASSFFLFFFFFFDLKGIDLLFNQLVFC